MTAAARTPERGRRAAVPEAPKRRPRPGARLRQSPLAVEDTGRTPGQWSLPSLPFVGPLSDRHAVEKRRSLPIHAYVGPNGHFKTATMVLDTLPSLAAGRPCLSTVRLIDPKTGNDHPLYEPFEHWDQLKTFRHGDLLLDEVAGAANARSTGLPEDIQNILNQLRRADVMMRWTAPDYSRADKIIRETSQGISLCAGYAPDRSVEARTDAEGNLRAWAPNRLASVGTYDGKKMAQFHSHQTTPSGGRKQALLRPIIRQWYWAPKTGLFDYYDTLDAVSLVSSLCTTCGGKKVSKTCRGHDDG